MTGNSDQQNNQNFTRKQQQNNQSSNGLSRGNIAAVEPYNHVPLRSGQTKLQENLTTYHPVYQQNHNHIKEDDLPLLNPNNNNNPDSQDLVNKMANLYTPRTDDADALKEFTVSKSDPKYQTLPYNTKFTVNLLSNKVVKNENLLDNIVTNPNENKEDPNSHISNLNMQSTHMTVHSAPLNAVNKNIATPISQNDLKKPNGKEVGNGANGAIPNGVSTLYQVSFIVIFVYKCNVNVRETVGKLF